MKSIKCCEVCGKLGTYHNSKLCAKHWNQMYKFGKTFDTNQRTVWDPNEIRTYEDYAEVDTYDQYGNVIVTYKLDLEDVKYLNNNKWRTVWKGKEPHKSAYLVTGHTIYFHRLILGDPNKEIDHINRDSTDNRKTNLRESFRSQQLANTRIRCDNTLGIKGVYFDKDKNSYHVELSINKKRYYSKMFKDINEAIYLRYLMENTLCKDIVINNNSQRIQEAYDNLSPEQRINIQTYFKNRAKAWV